MNLDRYNQLLKGYHEQLDIELQQELKDRLNEIELGLLNDTKMTPKEIDKALKHARNKLIKDIRSRQQWDFDMVISNIKRQTLGENQSKNVS